MGKYKVLVGPFADKPTGRLVDVDETEINVIAAIQAGLIDPADKLARDLYDCWFFGIKAED